MVESYLKSVVEVCTTRLSSWHNEFLCHWSFMYNYFCIRMEIYDRVGIALVLLLSPQAFQQFTNRAHHQFEVGF